MTKFALAVLAAVALTSISPLPTFAQSRDDIPSMQIPGGPNEPGRPDNPRFNAGPDNCGSELGFLKRVYPVQIAGVDKGTRVWVTEICPTFGLLRSEGNAEYLRPSIAKNKALTAALFSKDYSAEDVFAVRMMGDDTINLYVHHFSR